MVQVKLPEKMEKGANLLPDTVVDLDLVRVKHEARRNFRNKSCLVMVIMSVVFSIMTLKKICDLKEENIELMEQLVFERQKDAALKLAVRDNIPSARFVSHSYSPSEYELVAAQGLETRIRPRGWTINLSVLWTSPQVTPCDMTRLSHMLASEIYGQSLREVEYAPWKDALKADTEYGIEDEEIIDHKNLGRKKMVQEESEEYNYKDDAFYHGPFGESSEHEEYHYRNDYDDSVESSEEMNGDDGYFGLLK